MSIRPIALLLIGLLTGSLLIQGQEVLPSREQDWIIETEILLPNATLYNDIAIRQNPVSSTSYDNGTVTYSVGGLMLGTRWKWQNPARGWGLSVGIRAKALYNKITGNMGRNSDFYYLRYYTDDATGVTKFARINTINESMLLLALPLEANYTVLRTELFDAFISIGTEVGYFTMREVEISFRDNTMKPYESAVRKSIDHPVNNLYGAVYGTVGAAIGQSPRLIGEICLPGFYFSKKYFMLGTAQYFTSFRLSLQIPVFKSQPEK